MSDTPVSRRGVLAGAAVTFGSFSGCISTSKQPPGGGGDENDGGAGPTDVLKLGGSSTVFPITNTAGSTWNSNPPASDREYWGPGQYGIRTDERLADYWAGLYGFESGGSGPPFRITVGLSHSGTGLEKLREGQVDVGNSSAPVSAEFPEMDEETRGKYTDHVVGVDAQPIVVSQAIYDAGVTKLTADQVRGIYRGEITNWSGIDRYGGPDRKIQAVGRAVGSGTDTAFRANMLGGPDADMPGVDLRKGKNQQVKNVVARSDNAIAYMALSFVGNQTPAVALAFDEKTFVPGKNLADPDYPLARDLHCYTWTGTSKMEAAFLRLIITDFGQQNFVEPTGYAKLTDKRQNEELEKLPDVNRQ